MANSGEIEGILSKLKDQSPAGLAIALHIRFTAPAYLFQTYPKEWINLYSEQGLVMHDPIVGWGFTNTGSIRWSELGLSDPQGVLLKAREFKMNFGIALATEVEKSRSVSGFSRSDREFTDTEITALSNLTTRLHNLTAAARPLSAETRAELRKMSITFTHPLICGSLTAGQRFVIVAPSERRPR